MVRALGFLAIVVLQTILAGCDWEKIILGPTPPDQGIVIYLHADYVGPSQAINVDVSDLSRTEGPCSSGAEGEMPSWRDCISSIRVLPGWIATVYRDDDFKGRSMTITSDVPNLRNVSGPCDNSFNDCISSIRVRKQ